MIGESGFWRLSDWKFDVLDGLLGSACLCEVLYIVWCIGYLFFNYVFANGIVVRGPVHAQKEGV